MKVDLLVEPGIYAQKINPIIESLSYIAHMAKPFTKMEINNLGYWQDERFQNGTELLPHKSINWFLQEAYKERLTPDSYNSGSLISEGQVYAFKNNSPFVVFVVNKDIIHPVRGWNLGATCKFFCSVINVGRFEGYSEIERSRLIETLSLHELGHLFGLVDEQRSYNVEQKLGLHCTVAGCVMRQGMSIQEWVIMSHDLHNHPNSPFCQQCRKELNYNFSQIKSR